MKLADFLKADNPKHKKFLGMVKAGLPEGAIINAIVKEGLAKFKDF